MEMTRFHPYPAYKPSGISAKGGSASGGEWLGEIPEHWEVKKLKYVCTQYAVYGANEPAANYSDSGVRFLRTTDITDNGDLISEGAVYLPLASMKDYLLQNGDILFSRSGTIGRTFLYNSTLHGACAYAGYLVKFRLLRLRDPKFLFYFTKSLSYVDWLSTIAIESTIGNVNGQKYANLPIAWPSLVEQRAIAAFLDRETAKLDALVAKKERLIELLQEKRTALISHAVTKGLDPTVPMRDSGIEWLGEIAEHWRVKALKYAVSQQAGSVKTGPFGSQLLAEEMLDAEIKVYNQRNVIDKDAVGGDNFISKEKYDELFSFTVQPGDILVTTRGTIGRCFILPADAETGILHPCLMRIRPDESQYLPELLTAVIEESRLLQTQLFLLSDATTIDVVYSDTMKRAVFPIPPIKEQVEILNYVKSERAKIDALIAKVREGIEKLKEYRSALISAAVTGKIDVREEAVA